MITIGKLKEILNEFDMEEDDIEIKIDLDSEGDNDINYIYFYVGNYGDITLYLSNEYPDDCLCEPNSFTFLYERFKEV